MFTIFLTKAENMFPSKEMEGKKKTMIDVQ